MIISDANNVVSSVAFKASEIIAIYPITPSSTMSENASKLAKQNKTNVFGDIPTVIEMQSEAGAIATVHGALQTGALATTFTSSQGLLLMIPTLYKVAGQLLPFVLHVAARSVATHALSIFGDHSDVMAVRQTGCILLSSHSVQEAQDFALIATIATYRCSLPVIHFFDGFRTSHELNTIEPITDEIINRLLPHDAIAEFRNRALTPDDPVIRGTAANPDTYFQCREATNPYYDAAYDHIVAAMMAFGDKTGRYYQPYEYYGPTFAERVIIIMGSAAGTVKEVVDSLTSQNEKVGLVAVHLFRPVVAKYLLMAIPDSVKRIAVLDRTKEAGSQAEPLYLDIMTAFGESCSRGERATIPLIIGGRYGLSSKEFTPACVMAIYNELAQNNPRPRFTVGIYDDVTGLSLPLPAAVLPGNTSLNALFYGLGSDGTVSSIKNNIKIIGNELSGFVQGYFVYDSKKAGGLTVSHLRISHAPIHSAYLIEKADFIACHQDQFLDKYEMVSKLKPGGIFLLNTPYHADEIWHRLPQEVQAELLHKKARFYIINAVSIARKCQLGQRINTVMQTAFLSLSELFPVENIRHKLKEIISKSYMKKGWELVEHNWNAVDMAFQSVIPIPLDRPDVNSRQRPPIVPTNAPDFVKTVTAAMLAGVGDRLPVSFFPPDGTWPTGTARWEKRNIASEIPIWQSSLCTQCNHCVAACPHAAIRAKVVMPETLVAAPGSLDSLEVRARDMKGQRYILQVAPEDCTGCRLCVEICPAIDRKNPALKAINMQSRIENLTAQKNNFQFFSHLPDRNKQNINRIDIRSSQLLTPLFEFSGACAGCGETPYIKLLTQLFGDRMAIANATGCSSIYGGNLPTTPYTTNKDGRGPAWANSLFEDNAEFALGFRLTFNHQKQRAQRLLQQLTPQLPADIIKTLLDPTTPTEQKRAHICEIRNILRTCNLTHTQELLSCLDYLVDKSVWAIGGDGWAYDIGFGGLDHVLSLSENINILVLDTQCYSNTGGQQSKATPLGAIAKFAELGKTKMRKDLGVSMMMYGHVYVAQIAVGAQLNQTLKAIQEAEAYEGPSLIIAYSPCIEHGYDLSCGFEQTKNLVKSGVWNLYRYDPNRIALGKSPLQLDSRPPLLEDFAKTLNKEQRFRQLNTVNPLLAKTLASDGAQAFLARFRFLEELSHYVEPVTDADKAIAVVIGEKTD